MEININNVVLMKKSHPCGCNEFIVLRTGVDFKLKCLKCGREVFTPRLKILKYIKSVKSL